MALNMKSTKPKLNVRLLRKIQKHILEEPRRFLMSSSVIRATTQQEWSNIIRRWAYDASKSMPPCKTAACIAGWADIFTGGDGSHYLARERAAAAIGIDPGVCWGNHSLFSDKAWPEPFKSRYEASKTPAKRAKIAADRIEWLITNGE